MDRMLNGANYPALYFPEIYIMDGGYKNFFEQFTHRCDPPGQYMPMRNPHYKEELKFHQRMKHTNLASQKHRAKLRTVSLRSLRVRKAASTTGGCGQEAACVAAACKLETASILADVINHTSAYAGQTNTHHLSHLIPSSDGPEIEMDHRFLADWELS